MRSWIARGLRIDASLLPPWTICNRLFVGARPNGRAQYERALFFEGHPDQVDRIFSDISRLVSFADVDRGHPPDLAIRRRRGVRVHPLPLARIDGEALDDDQIVLEQVLAWDIWIIEVAVLRL